MPLFRIFRREVFGEAGPNETQVTGLVNLTQLASEVLGRELQTVGFWRSTPAQARLKRELLDLFLEDHEGLPPLFPRREALIARTLEWAHENNAVLIGE